MLTCHFYCLLAITRFYSHRDFHDTEETNMC